MNRNKIEKLIPKAIEAIQSVLQEGNSTKKIPKEYKGYIASFGAAIVQSGLKQTVAFFENSESRANADRSKLMKVILVLVSTGHEKYPKLLEYIIKNEKDNPYIKQDIIDAAIALKLALGVFEFEKAEDEPEIQEGTV